MKAATRQLLARTIYALAVAVCLLHLTGRPAGADEPDVSAPWYYYELNGEDVFSSEVPCSNEMPYLNILLKNLGVAVGTADCQSKGYCGEDVSAALCRGDQTVCGRPCCAQNPFGVQQVVACDAESDCKTRATVSAGRCDHQELWEKLIAARTASAALEAALVTRQQLDQQRQQLLEALVETTLENAKLQARVELAKQRAAAQQELAKAMVENERLKAQIELVSQRHELIEGQAKAMAMNERLKTKLAKLEKKGRAKSAVAKSPEVKGLTPTKRTR